MALAASTPSPTLCSPRSQKRLNESLRSAAPTPCLRHGRRVKSAWTKPPPYVSPVQIVPAAISSPARTTHQSVGSKRSLPSLTFDHDSKSRGVKSHASANASWLAASWKSTRVLLRVERDDAQPVGPLGCGRRRLELDAHLAEDAHGAVAKRLEEPAGQRSRPRRLRSGSCVHRRGPRPPRARSRSASRSRARARRGARTHRRASAHLVRGPRRSRRCGRRRGRRARPARGRAPTTRPPDRPARTRSRGYSDDSSAPTSSVTAAASAATAGVKKACSMRRHATSSRTRGVLFGKARSGRSVTPLSPWTIGGGAPGIGCASSTASRWSSSPSGSAGL